MPKKCRFWLEAKGRFCRKFPQGGSDFCSIHLKTKEKPRSKPEEKKQEKFPIVPVPMLPKVWKKEKREEQKGKLPLTSCEPIAEAGSSVIKRCMFFREQVAVKTVFIRDEDILQDVIQELNWDATHPNIANFFALVFKKKPGKKAKATFMYKLATSDLSQFLENNRKQEIPKGLRTRLWADIKCGIAALHTQGFTHNDLKPANILVYGKGTDISAAIADLASISRLSATWNPCGLTYTATWLPPEEAEHWGCSLDRDLWALGVIGLSLFDPDIQFWAYNLKKLLPNLAETHRKVLDSFAIADFANVFSVDLNSLAFLSKEKQDLLAELLDRPALQSQWGIYYRLKGEYTRGFKNLQMKYSDDPIFQEAIALINASPTLRRMPVSVGNCAKPAQVKPRKVLPLEIVFQGSKPLQNYRFSKIINNVALSPKVADRLALLAGNIWYRLPLKHQNLTHLRTIHTLLAIVLEGYPQVNELDVSILPHIFDVIPMGLLGHDVAGMLATIWQQKLV